MTKKSTNKGTNNAIELNFQERLTITSILPKQGSKLEQIVVRSLIKKFEFSEEDIKEFEVIYNNNTVRWNEKGNTAKFNFELSDVEVEILKESCKLLDEKKMVNQQNLSLIEKIEEL